MKTLPPCPWCGGKPNRARHIMHKKGCQYYGLKAGEVPVKTTGPMPLAPGSVVEIQVVQGVILDLPTRLHVCCNEVMRRTDGAPYEQMCQHFRLLTAECEKCRQQHHGVLTYRCAVCGRETMDAPQLASGPETALVNSIAR